MEFFSLWDEAASDLESENRERAIHTASLASAGVWAFLAAAKSEPEFNTRLALAESNLSTVAAESGLSVEDVTDIMRRRYALLLEASDNPFAKDDDSDDDDDDSDDSDSNSDDDGDDDDDDDSSDSDDDDSDSDDSDSDDDGDDSDGDDSDDSSDDDSGNPFAKDSSLKTATMPEGDVDDEAEENGGGHCEDCGAWLDEKGLCPSCLPNSERNEDERADAEDYWGAKRSETGRHGSLKAQILAGVNPLSPEFGKTAAPAAAIIKDPVGVARGLGGGTMGDIMDLTKPDEEIEKEASEEPGDNEYGGRYRKPESLDIPDSNDSIQYHTPRTVDPEHSPDAGQVHIMSPSRMWNGRHNVMVIDANGNSQWPSRHRGQLAFDNPHAIVTSHDIIHKAMDHAKHLNETLGVDLARSQQYGGHSDSFKQASTPTSRIAALKAQIEAGVDPLSPEFGKEGFAAALPLLLRAAPMAAGLLGGGKSEGAEDEDGEPEGVLEEGAESSRRPFVREARDWNGETTPTEFCNELKKYDDLWNTGGREHDSGCPIHGGPNADEAFSSWKDHVSKQSSKIAMGSQCPNCGSDKALVAVPSNIGGHAGLKWMCQGEGCGWSGAPEEAKMNRGDVDKFASAGGWPEPSETGQEILNRNNPDHPDYNDFDKNTWHEDNFGGLQTTHVMGHPVHTFPSTRQAYNESQTNDSIKDGDVLSVPSENVHGYLHQAWPIATHHDGDPGEFHTAKPGHEDEMLAENSKYPKAHAVAYQLHSINKTGGAAADLAATTNTGGIPQQPKGFGGADVNQATTKPRQQPAGGPGGIQGPAGPSGPDGGIAGPGSPGDDNAPSGIENFNPSSNGGDAKAGMDDMPDSNAPTTKDAVLVRVAREHPELTLEQVAKVAELAAVEADSGMNYTRPPVADGPLTTQIVDKAEEMGQQVEKKVMDTAENIISPPGTGKHRALPEPVARPRHAASLEDDMPLLLG
jgi:hypothetical protein